MLRHFFNLLSFEFSAFVRTPCNHALGASLWQRREIQLVRAYTFSCKNSPTPPDTHLSARPAVFLLPLPLSLRAIPPLLFYLEISNDPPDTFVLSYSSPGTFISVSRSGCSGSSVLHVLKSALAHVIALHLLTLRSSYWLPPGWESVATLIRDSGSYKLPGQAACTVPDTSDSINAFLFFFKSSSHASFCRV